MERFFAASQNSPLHMLRMLESNLRRERRIFAVAVGLLIFTAVCGAGVTGFFMLTSSLKNEEEIAQAAMRGANVNIFSRYNMLTLGALMLDVGATEPTSGVLQAPDNPRCKAYPSGREDQALAAACQAAHQMIPEESTKPILQFSDFDGTASSGFGFFADTDDKVAPPERLAALATFAKIYMNTRGIAPFDAARMRRVMWFVAPASLGFPKPTVIMFMVVARDETPYALVFTRVTLDHVLRESTSDLLESQIAIFDNENRVLAGDDTEYLRYVNGRLAKAQAGVYQWLGRGWGARLDMLALGIGHIVVALPLATELAAKRVQLTILLIVTGALTAMLLAMYRYWNFRFLTRSYEQACRAVEGEILNHLLAHATPVGLCIALKDDFSLIAANQVARSLFDLTDASPMRLPAGLSEAFVAAGIAPAQEGREAMIQQIQYTLHKSGGDALHLKVSYASAVVNKTSVLFCAIADISEQHEVERLLRSAKETSDAAAKAKLSFFAAMSHEIRTPLSSLVGNLELVALGPLAAEQEARVQAMQASASALLHVVNDVLDFSKMDIGEMRLSEEWGSIRELVVRVMVAHAPLANRQGLRLFVVIDRACPGKLFFDPIRVSQILNNLLGNALKFTYSGKVVVRARWVSGALELSVADSGIGIPESQREKLFQPFMQGDAHRLTQARGTGLGLSICVRLCELMKGKISLDSTEGVGTRIQVSLPLLADESPGSGDAALLEGKAAILCRASEYREWFENLYDPDRASVTYMTHPDAALAKGCEYLIVTDEFSEQEIQAVWKDEARVIRMTQNGPLVPVHWADGVLEVSIFSLKGFRDAVAAIEGRQRASARPATGAALPSPNARKTGPVVVIAEDNRLNRGLLRDQLLTLGASVLEAHDGEEALELLRKHRVDIVLTDMDMPKMSGAELLAAARALDPAMRIYAISASPSAQDVERGRARGFTDYLTKPVPLAVLAGVLQTVGPVESNAAADTDAPGGSDRQEDDDLPSRFPQIPAAYVSDFLAQIEEDIVALDDICKREDARKLRAWAHKLAGGLTVLGPSMMVDECQELRALLRESESWAEDVDTYTAQLRLDLIELRATLHAALHVHQK
ncbi:two-component regulatory system sensor kinase [Caballeronia turbans]|uniref:hybrid sensor histidine kinase/response regulator n=1 Tax=Caballeronia sp. INML2 TaxID=2921748 RepID=UPI00074B4927|nr:hybrid sensor histidine kinase/response regulator [Caballeronia sp. INML2]SAL23928.1 two-component regulatory system sensor kinase [Caballeronia turbans]